MQAAQQLRPRPSADRRARAPESPVVYVKRPPACREGRQILAERARMPVQPWAYRDRAFDLASWALALHRERLKRRLRLLTARSVQAGAVPARARP